MGIINNNYYWLLGPYLWYGILLPAGVLLAMQLLSLRQGHLAHCIQFGFALAYILINGCLGSSSFVKGRRQRPLYLGEVKCTQTSPNISFTEKGQSLEVTYNGHSNQVSLNGDHLDVKLGSLSFVRCRNGLIGHTSIPKGTMLVDARDRDILILGKKESVDKIAGLGSQYLPIHNLNWVDDSSLEDVIAMIITDTPSEQKRDAKQGIIRPSIPHERKKTTVTENESSPLSKNLKRKAEIPKEEAPEVPSKKSRRSEPKDKDKKERAGRNTKVVGPTEPVKGAKEESVLPANTVQSTGSLVDRIKTLIDAPLRDGNGWYISVGKICHEGEWRISPIHFASGDSGRVYDAWKGEISAAAKVIDYRSDDELRRIRKEEATLAVLDWPRIPKPYCTRVDGNTVSLVMEHRGDTIADRLPLGPNVCKKIIRQLIEVLEYLHSNHVYHGDIKPGNIIWVDEWREYGGLSLIDFGSVQFGEPDSSKLVKYGSSDWVRVGLLPELLDRNIRFDFSAKDFKEKAQLIGLLSGTLRSEKIKELKKHPYLKEE